MLISAAGIKVATPTRGGYSYKDLWERTGRAPGHKKGLQRCEFQAGASPLCPLSFRQGSGLRDRPIWVMHDWVFVFGRVGQAEFEETSPCDCLHQLKPVSIRGTSRREKFQSTRQKFVTRLGSSHQRAMVEGTSPWVSPDLYVPLTP